MVVYRDKDGKRKTRKTIMREFQIEEISAVDRPAQAGARATLTKREGSIEKRLALSTATDGHAHMIRLINTDGSDAKSGETSGAETVNGKWHSHNFVVDDAGNIIIADSDGHTHGVSILVKNNDEVEILLSKTDLDEDNGGTADPTQSADTSPEDDMSKQDDKTQDGSAVTQDQLDALEKRAVRAEKVSALDFDVRAHFNSLEKADQDAFLDLTSDEQTALVKQAQEADKVVYKSEDGTEYRASDDERLVKQAKQLDDERKKRKEMEAKAKKAQVVQKAAELKHLPGDDADREALVEAIQLLPTEKREAAERCLKAHDASNSGAFQRTGTSAAPSADSSDDPVEAIAKKLQESDPTLSDAQAYTKALSTDAGKAFYAKHAGLEN